MLEVLNKDLEIIIIIYLIKLTYYNNLNIKHVKRFIKLRLLNSVFSLFK